MTPKRPYPDLPPGAMTLEEASKAAALPYHIVSEAARALHLGIHHGRRLYLTPAEVDQIRRWPRPGPGRRRAQLALPLPLEGEPLEDMPPEQRRLYQGPDGHPLTAREVLALYEHDRPRRRGDCLPGGRNAARPCPWVSCRWHLYLNVSFTTGAISCPHHGLELWEISETCALDVAERGGITLEEAGVLLNITRERVRQIEANGLAHLHRRGQVLAEHLDGGTNSEQWPISRLIARLCYEKCRGQEDSR